MRQMSTLSSIVTPACWSNNERDGSDVNWAKYVVFITRIRARIAAEDALTAVLAGSRSSPPLKHIITSF